MCSVHFTCTTFDSIENVFHLLAKKREEEEEEEEKEKRSSYRILMNKTQTC